MRRIIALVLIALFSLQTTASAAVPGQGVPDVYPMLAALQNAQAFATMMGQGQRYALMHAPRPSFDRYNIPRPTVHQTDFSASRRVNAIHRAGVPLSMDLKSRSHLQRPAYAPVAPSSTTGSTTVPAGTKSPNIICQVSTRVHGMSCNPGPTPTPYRPTPTPSPTPTPAPTPTPTPIPTPTPTPTPLTTPTPIPVTPTPVPTASPVQSLPASTTGINAWWSYESGSVPGIGPWLVNVANGNLLVSATDADVPERGLDLSFRRTYNSQSRHDAAGSDGSVPSVYGNGWTNTFDAHVAFNGSVLSIYDMDGARYDYTLSSSCTATTTGTSCWAPPPGMQGTTVGWDGCGGYQWTQKDGTIVWFYAPFAACSTPPGYWGRLYQVVGRNVNNYILFTYNWVGGNASSIQNLSSITASHSDGHSLTLTFGLVNGINELTSITLPDNQTTIGYSYDSTGDLIGVTRPGNSSYASLPESYTYASGHQMTGAAGPRATTSLNENGGTPNDGDEVLFFENGSDQTTSLEDRGVVNFAPANDGLGIALQTPEPTGLQYWRTEGFSGYNGNTTVTDTYGHARTWTYDGSGRGTQLQAWSSANASLITIAAWDSNNDLLSIVDPRSNETDYGYDARGNLVAMAQPTVTTSSGPLRPTTTYSYDGHNNLLSYCDPVYNATNSWYNPANPPPVCPTAAGSAGAATYVYDNVDSNEPFGVIVQSYSPMNYETTYGYANGPVFDNYGLPTQIAGASYTQNDGTTRTPITTLAYNTYGDLTSYSNGNGTWIMTYDAFNRLQTTVDPDPGNPTSYTYYNPDGTVSKTETPYQHANGWGTTNSYDADGNVTKSSVYRMTTYSSTPAQYPTTNWYDGEDRLVEVQQAPDPNNDAYQNPWTTRYLYDISQTSGVFINPGNLPYQAYGNLYKTQELLAGDGPTTMTSFTPQSLPNPYFEDLNGNAFDGLDRPIMRYSFIAENGSSPESLVQETLTYDQSSYFSGDFAGRLAADCKSTQPQQQCQWYNYDARGAATQVHFSDTLSPDRSSTYDPDGHTMSITSAVFGTQYYAYNVDGRKTSEQEANGGGVTSPAIFSHEYYADDSFKQLDVASSNLNQTGLVAFSYRPDGKIQTQTVSDAAQSNVGSTSIAFTYTAAGRVSSRTESGTGANASPTSWAYDPYGRLSQEIFPTCSQCGAGTVNPPLSGLVWDPQGQLMQSAYSTHNYSTRGEVLGASGVSLLANGVSVPGEPTDPGYSGPYSPKWDSLAGAMLSTSANLSDSSGDSMLSTTTMTYDPVGRMLTSSLGSSSSPSLGSNAFAYSTGDSVTRAYDDENHTISSSFVDTYSVTSTSAASGLALYQWGPGGHPVLVGSAANFTSTVPLSSAVQYDTLHWDGSQLVFTTNAAGQVDDIKVGTNGDITPLDKSFTGLTFYDRGPDGSVMYCHNYTGVTGYGAVDPYSTSTPCVGGAITSTTGYTFYMPSSILWLSNPSAKKLGTLTYRAVGVGQGMLLGMLRTDGMTDGINTIQGVRTYDGNSGQWTTSDALAGVDTDPTSQKGYLWNGGNPLANQDPSGNYYGHYDWCQINNSCNSIFGDSASDISGILAAIATPDAVVGHELKTIAVTKTKSTNSQPYLTCVPAGALSMVTGPLCRTTDPQNTFVQGCLVSGSAKIWGCVLFDLCGDIVVSPVVGTPGWSITGGVATPFRGHNAQGIYTGLSGSLGFFDGVGGQVSGNTSGIATSGGVGAGRFGLSGSYGAEARQGWCGGPK